MMVPLLAAVAYGFAKGFSQRGRESFHPEQDLFGPLKEELVYRGIPFWTASKLPYGSTAVAFAADHVASELNGNTLAANGAVARFGDVLLGGLLYEVAFRQFGIFGAAASHVAHNLAIGVGSKARRKLR